MTMTIAQFIRNDCIQRKSRHWRLILPRGDANGAPQRIPIVRICDLLELLLGDDDC